MNEYVKGDNMGIKKIVDLFKKDSSKVSRKSKVSTSKSPKMKSHKDQKANEDKSDWANRSGVYKKLSDQQKKYLDKVNKLLDQEDEDK
jgi:hypothetical protein